MKQKLIRFLAWYSTTGWIIGHLILPVVFIVGIETVFFTAACKSAGYYCEYSLGSDPNASIANKMAQLEGYLSGALDPVYEEPPVLNEKRKK
jgi:hypothetical protein